MSSCLPEDSVPRSDHTFSILRNRIISGLVQPGTLLAESAVARDLGVSRVPVREALFELERDGLVHFSGSGRAYVTELSPKDFEELFGLRLLLEPAAARLAAPALRDSAEALQKNIAAMRKVSETEVTRLDLDFHEIILEASGNRRLLKVWRSLRCELELWLGGLQRIRQIQTRDLRRQTILSHQKLIEFFQTESPAACEREARQHILGWRDWMPVAEPEASPELTKRR